MTEQLFDVIVIGAGFGGIGAAIQLKRLGFENFAVLDREDDLGGTWYVNHYPGLTVDVPTTTYSYFFEPNPNWSRLYSTGAEIRQYAEDVADKYDIRRHIRFNTSVDGARWDGEAGLWRVALAGGETIRTRYLITATGFLSQPHTPDIPGVHDFTGTVIHTADWDDAFDPTGRRIAIIGTGATAVQLIPELAKKAAELTVYHAEHGDVRVPQSYRTPSGYRLGSWVGDQRRAYNASPRRLSPERIADLEALGMVWEAKR